MEGLSDALQPYKDVVGMLAGVTTIGQFFSGGFICKDIKAQGSTDGIPMTPFLGGSLIGILMLEYSLIMQDTTMLVVNLFAIALNALYLAFYILYVKDKSSLLRPISIGVGFTAVLWGYARVESRELVQYRYGLILTVLMLALIANPLLDVKEVIRTKNSSSFPFPIIVSGMVVSVLWLLYGIILKDDFMVIQNVANLVIFAIQLVFCMIYPRTAPKPKAKQKAN